MPFFENFRSYLETVCVLETDSQSVKRRKITLVLIAVITCITGIITAAYAFFIGGINNAVVMPCIYVIVVGTALIFYLPGKRVNTLLYPFLVMVLVIPAIFQLTEGGLSGRAGDGILFWSILAPLGSLMFQSIRQAVGWFIAYLAVIAVSISVDKYFVQYAEDLDYTLLVIDNVMSLVMLSITIFLTMLYFVRAFQKEHDKAERLVVDLQTSNRELEAALNELSATQAELVQSEKMGALGKLAAGLAHEINNPIGALRSTADTSSQCLVKVDELLAGDDLFSPVRGDARLQKYLNILRENGRVFTQVSERVSGTVQSFIKFARLDKAGFDVVDLHQGLDNTLALLQQEIGALVEVVRGYGDIPKIACYPGELNQVFLHLLTNAAQAIDGRGTITIRTFDDGGHIHIQITDTGIGIPPEKIGGLFDPGFTREGARVKAGLGLFTSFNIMQKHRGRLEVESAVGQGSTFTMVIPTDLDDRLPN